MSQRQLRSLEYALYNDLAKVVGQDRIYNANDPAGLQKAHDHHGCDAAIGVRTRYTKYAELDLVIPFVSDWEYGISREAPAIVGDSGAVYERLGSYDAALVDDTTAIQQGYVDAYDARGNVHFERGAVHNARRAFEAAVADYSTYLQTSPYHP